MDNNAQYQSLFKSFRKTQPKEPAEPIPPPQGPPKFVAGGRPVTAQKSVDELLAGRTEVRPEKREPDEIEGPHDESLIKPRKSIDQILAGARATRRSSTLRIGKPAPGESLPDITDDWLPLPARKQVSEILVGNRSSSTLRPLKSSHGRPQLTYYRMETSLGITPSASLQELMQTVEIESPCHTPIDRRHRTPLVSYDFQIKPDKRWPKKSKSFEDSLIGARSSTILAYCTLSPSDSSTTFSSSVHDGWHKNKAFDALLSSIEDSTQTDEFDSTENEESQTELDINNSKWTQKPIKSSAKKANRRLLHEDSDGCGCDLQTIPEEPKVKEAVSIPSFTSLSEEQEQNLATFARNTSKLLLSLINVDDVKSDINIEVPEDNQTLGKHKSIKKKIREKSIITEFDRGLPYLNKLAMHTLCCDSSHIACANVPLTDRSGNETRTGPEVKNIITVWAARNIFCPKFFLRVWGQVTAIKLAFSADIIAAGSHNGGLNIWDLREDEKKHVYFEGVYVRTPSFHTGCLDGENHQSEIIGLEVLPETSSSAQIISMEKNNKIICWSVIHSPVVDREDFSVNSVAWSNLRVRVRQVLNLPELFRMNSLNSTCLNVWEGNHKYFLVATNNGYVGKGRIVGSTFGTHCEKFFANTRDSLIRIQHINVNVKINLIIAACNDFSVRIFEMSKQKAIISIACVEVPAKVLWSKQRNSVFYVSFKDQVVIWDLIASDLTPMKKCKCMGIIDFDLVMHQGKECMVMIADGGKKLFRVVPPCNLAPLDPNHEKLMRHYITVSH